MQGEKEREAEKSIIYIRYRIRQEEIHKKKKGVLVMGAGLRVKDLRRETHCD